MFIFSRTEDGPAEAWEITLPSDHPDAERRFGPALKHSARNERFHSVGVLVVLRGETAKIFVGGKDGLTQAEQNQLSIEIEMLVGKHVWEVGAEPEKGWYLWEGLK